MKPWYNSLTIRGAAIAIAAMVLKQFGIEASEEQATVIIDAILTIVALSGSGASIIGRLRAHEVIR